MTDTKISALPSGGAIQAGDAIPVARSGANYQVNAGTAAAKTASDNSKTSVAAVSGATVVGNLSGFADVSGTVQDSGIPINKVAQLNVAETYTGQQNFAEQALTDGASIAWNLNTQQAAAVTLAGNRTLANPTNMVAGGSYVLRIVQDATGSRTLAYGTAYKWPGGTAPTLSTAANAVDVVSFYCDGSHMLGSIQQAFA